MPCGLGHWPLLFHVFWRLLLLVCLSQQRAHIFAGKFKRPYSATLALAITWLLYPDPWFSGRAGFRNLDPSDGRWFLNPMLTVVELLFPPFPTKTERVIEACSQFSVPGSRWRQTLQNCTLTSLRYPRVWPVPPWSRLRRSERSWVLANPWKGSIVSMTLWMTNMDVLTIHLKALGACDSLTVSFWSSRNPNMSSTTAESSMGWSARTPARSTRSKLIRSFSCSCISCSASRRWKSSNLKRESNSKNLSKLTI